MIRVTVVVLLLHHIEGVCKPLSAAREAVRRVFEGLSRDIAGRDGGEAVERAQAAQAAAVERARDAAGRATARPVVVEGEVVRPALGQATPLSDWLDDVRRREGRR